jgi:peptidoglycan/LPS O-acetylase OafA/YrhL
MTSDQLRARLSRRTTGGRYLPEVDGLRFLSIALVVLYHCYGLLGVANGTRVLRPPLGEASPASVSNGLAGLVLQNASRGVLVFFMLSGFVLSLPFLAARRGQRRPVDVRAYALRRLTRIEPPYVVAITVLFVATWVAGSRVGIGNYPASLAYLHQFVYGSTSPYDGVTWSLEVEVQFYALVPILALLFAPTAWRRRLLIAGVALVAIDVQLSGALTGARLQTLVLDYLEFFLVGFLVADVHSSRPEGAEHPSRWDLVFAASLVLLLIWPQGQLQSIGVTPALFGLGMGALRGSLVRRALSHVWVATIGGMCYSIYLTHYPVVMGLGRLLLPIGTLPLWAALPLTTVVLAPLVLLVGGAFFVAIERPCMDPAWPARALAWGERVLRRRDAVAAVVESTDPAS